MQRCDSTDFGTCARLFQAPPDKTEIIAFSQRKEDVFDGTKLEIRHFAQEIHDVSSIAIDRSRFSSRGPTLSRLKKVAQPTYIDTYIYVRMCFVCVWLAYRIAYYFIVLYSGCYRLLIFLLLFLLLFMRGYGYVRIIATNISHRPTFRSTTQHNHCRISLRFFFLLFLHFLPFSSRPIGFHIVNITESIKFKSYNRSNIYIIYIIYIILKLTRYILYWLGTLSS